MRSSTALAPLALALAAGSASADVLSDWNAQLLQAVRTTAMPPPRASRAMAMVDVAMFDAVNGITGRYEPYGVTGQPRPAANRDAAAATAAHDVLVAVFPTLAAGFDAQLATSLSGIHGAPLDRGVAWGQACAADILGRRANDNSTLVVPYTPGVGPGVWIPTPPEFANALLPNWPLVTPFALASGAQFRQAGPPALDSAAYTQDFLEVKSLGQNTSAVRTPDQTQIALFWADGGGTETPPGHWLRIADEVTASAGLDLPRRARVLALVSIGLADAAISAWDNKYAHNHWRPVTGIRDAETDGNPLTLDDDTWTPLIATPPFPSYASGHSTFSAAAARVLGLVLRSNDIPFSTTSNALPGVTRSFAGFEQAAAEAGQSRIYGGIHWQYDNQDALSAGRSIGSWVFSHVLRKVGDVDHDDCVTRADLHAVIGALGQANPDADVNHDGVVDYRDVALVARRLEPAGSCALP